MTATTAQELRRARDKAVRRAAAENRDLRWPMVIVIGQLILLIACIIGYRVTGLSVQWSMPAPVPLIIASLVIWVITYPRTQTDAALAFALLLSGAMIVVATQYPALAAGRPLVDEALLRADHALGVDVPSVMAWMRRYPVLSDIAFYAYETYLPQQFVLIWVLAWRQDRRGMWMFLAQQHLCLALALIICTLWPASEPYAYLGLEGAHPQTLSVEQIAAYNSGAETVVRVGVNAGLVSFPSCHAAGALFFIWAFRRIPVLAGAAIVVNGLLLLASVAHGVHYFVDVLAGMVLAVLLIATTEWLVDRLAPFFRRPAPVNDHVLA